MRRFSLLAMVLAGLLLAGCGLTAAPQGPAYPPPQPASPTRMAEPTLPAYPAPGGEETALPAGLPAVTRLPAGDLFTWQPIVSGLTLPVDLKTTPADPQAFYVIEKPGRIQRIENGQIAPYPFLDLTDRVGSKGSEQGLLGFDFDPNYASNGFFYVNYTDLSGNTVISRFSRMPLDQTQADPASEEVLIRVDQPYPNHNGGGVEFGPDGYLYLSLGDGGSGGDPLGAGQNLNTLLGKLLRIDVSTGRGYAAPVDNPFTKSAEIWAYGLRNPWRFSFDRQTGDLYLPDVGQNQWEEVNFQPAGSPGGVNYGWNFREGAHAYQGTPPADLELTDPVFEYRHGPHCSITGGYVYRGSELPELSGVYIFGDYCSGTVWGLLQTPEGWMSAELWQTGLPISAFGQDEAGELYLLDIGGGRVFRLVRSP